LRLLANYSTFYYAYILYSPKTAANIKATKEKAERMRIATT